MKQEDSKICIKKNIILIGFFTIFIFLLILFSQTNKNNTSLSAKAETFIGFKNYCNSKKTLQNPNCVNNFFGPPYSVDCTDPQNPRGIICIFGCNKSTGLCKTVHPTSTPNLLPTAKRAYKTSIVKLLTPTKIPTVQYTLTPTSIVASQLEEFENFLNSNNIDLMDNRVILKQSTQTINEILSVDLQNKLDQMLSDYFKNPQLNDYVFIVTNDEIRYTEDWNISGLTGTTYYVYFYKNCNPTAESTICFDPSDNSCSKNLKKCQYFGSLEIKNNKDYQHNHNSLYEWSIGGAHIPPNEDKYPWIFGVDNNDNVYTLASRSLISTVMVEEKAKLGNSKIFIGYSTRAGYLLIEIYRENNNIVLRGVDLR